MKFICHFAELFFIFIFTSILAGCNLPLCELGEYRCFASVKNNCLEQCTDESCSDDCLCDNESRIGCTEIGFEKFNGKCELKMCGMDGTEYTKVDTCYYGYNETKLKEDCLKLCEDGEIDSVTDEKTGKSKIVKCEDSKWLDVEICTFGLSENERLSCADPCDICMKNGYHIRCGLLYSPDTQKIYSCDDNGFTEYHGCTNDFSVDDEVTVDSQKFYQYYEMTNDSENLEEAALVEGICGECSSFGVPDYCSVVDGQSVYRRCVNGKMTIESELLEDENTECGRIENKTKCFDTYHQEIYVDVDSNQYYCGDCNTNCHSGQKCENGRCVAKFECVNHYATIQVGARIVKAYCIENEHDLIELSNRVNQGMIYSGSDNANENFDKAYVLMNSVELNETWQPIGNKDHPFYGIFYGNDNAITIKGDMTQTSGVAGLFGYIKNSHIESLQINYPKQINIEVSDKDFNFGGLAGYVVNSQIEDIQLNHLDITVDLSKIKDNVEESMHNVKVGGLIGRSDSSEFKEIEVNADVSVINGRNMIVGGVIGFASKLSLKDCTVDVNVNGENDAVLTAGIGGVVGFIDQVINVSGIRTISGKTITVTGFTNVGGLFGIVYQDIDDGIISNKGVNEKLKFNVTGYIRNIGGAIGVLSCRSNITMPDLIEISDFNIESSSVKLLDDSELKYKLEYGSNLMKNRYIGGFVGQIDGQISENTSITLDDNHGYKRFVVKDVQIDSFEFINNKDIGSFNTDTGKLDAYLGGVFGYIRNAYVENVAINNINFDTKSLRNYIGGVSGCSSNAIYKAIIVNSLRLNASELVHHFIGAVNGNAVTNGIYDANVHDVKVNVSASSIYSGGIIGYGSKIVLDDVHVDDLFIAAGARVGGLVGHAYGCSVSNASVNFNSTFNGISDESNELTLKGSEIVGGVIGFIQSSVSLKHVYIAEKISGSHWIGGVVGYSNYSYNFSVDDLIAIVNINIKGNLKSPCVGGVFGGVYNLESKYSVDLNNFLTIVNMFNNSEYIRRFGEIVSCATNSSLVMNLFNGYGLMNVVNNGDCIQQPLLTLGSASEFSTLYQTMKYLRIGNNDGNTSSVCDCTGVNCLYEQEINGVDSIAKSDLLDALNDKLCMCDKTIEDDNDNHDLQGYQYCMLEDSNTCDSIESPYVSGNLCLSDTENQIGDSGESNPKNIHCKSSEYWRNYSCSVNDFKNAIHCGGECDALIKNLCNDEHACDFFTLPFPKGGAPVFCKSVADDSE